MLTIMVVAAGLFIGGMLFCVLVWAGKVDREYLEEEVEETEWD